MDEATLRSNPRYRKYIAAFDAMEDNDDGIAAAFLDGPPEFPEPPKKARKAATLVQPGQQKDLSTNAAGANCSGTDSAGLAAEQPDQPERTTPKVEAEALPEDTVQNEHVTAPGTVVESEEDATVREIDEIFERGMRGDISTVPELERIFKQCPSMLDSFGDLVVQATQEMMSVLYAKKYPARVAIAEKMVQLRTELDEPGTTPLERLLIRRVSLCWLDVALCEIAAANHLKSRPETAPSCQAIQRRLTAASNRFNAAVRTLAQTKKMLRPPVSRVQVEVNSRRQADLMPEAVRARSQFSDRELDSLFETGKLA